MAPLPPYFRFSRKKIAACTFPSTINIDYWCCSVVGVVVVVAMMKVEAEEYMHTTVCYFCLVAY
jgi:hypothetical protein